MKHYCQNQLREVRESYFHLMVYCDETFYSTHFLHGCDIVDVELMRCHAIGTNGSSVQGNQRPLMDSPHKRPVLQKIDLFHGAQYTRYVFILHTMVWIQTTYGNY